jgi:hypothetical protein
MEAAVFERYDVFSVTVLWRTKPSSTLISPKFALRVQAFSRGTSPKSPKGARVPQLHSALLEHAFMLLHQALVSKIPSAACLQQCRKTSSAKTRSPCARNPFRNRDRSPDATGSAWKY